MEEFVIPRPRMARLLDLSEYMVDRLVERGIIQQQRTPSGRHYFRPADVDTARAHLKKRSK